MMRTLRRELTLYGVGLSLVMILAYSALLPVYFVAGATEALSMLMKIEANEFDRKYKINPSIPLPVTSSMRSYIGIEHLPSKTIDMFPPETHSDRTVQQLEYTTGVDAGLHLLLTYKMVDGETLYLVQHLSEEALEKSDESIEHLIILMWLAGLTFLLVIILANAWLLRRVSSRTSRLSQWTQTLTANERNALPPDFGYKEFNDVASQLTMALNRLTEVLEREHHFVRNASHELRAPIAIIQSNIELLNRQTQHYQSSKSVRRIERAAQNMKQLTETLLWLSRDDSEQLQPTSISLHEMVNDVIEENSYLLERKNIHIELPKTSTTVVIIETPFRIALSNLIRNAFQHAGPGTINIELTPCSITIRNNNSSEIESDHGYGLGLLLVQKIVDRLQWKIEYQICSDIRETTITF